MSDRVTKDEYFMDLVKRVKTRATCIRRSVGAIITTYNGQVLSTGYNGVPRGFAHCIDLPCPGANDPSGDTRRCLAVHAEINALMQCSDVRRAYCIYVTCLPCFECAKAILNTPIKRVVYLDPYPGPAAELFKAAEVELVCTEDEK